MIKKIYSKFRKFFYLGNRKFIDYEIFLENALQNNFNFSPLIEFSRKDKFDKNTIGMRHDIDFSLNHAMNFAEIENKHGVKATYFVLHTAKYFYSSIRKNKINKKLISNLQYLQNNLGHEIGLHIDLMTIEKAYKQNPDDYLLKILNLLRSNGIKIFGVAPHGSFLTNTYRKENKKKQEKGFKNIYTNPEKDINLKKFDLEYEAYSLKKDCYLSDAKFSNQKRWDLFSIDFENLFPRTIVLTHPEHWAKSKSMYYTHNLYLKLKYSFEYLNHYFNLKRK